MPKVHVRTELQQAGFRGEVHGSHVQAEYLSRPEDQRPISERIGRRQQDYSLDVVRQLIQARCVAVLDALGQIAGVRKRKAAGELGCAHASVKLDQGKRIAVRLFDDPGPDALVKRT